jgi:hypothetical protein
MGVEDPVFVAVNLLDFVSHFTGFGSQTQGWVHDFVGGWVNGRFSGPELVKVKVH